MGKVGNLEKIIEEFGPHLHDEPHEGWRADRVIDHIVPTHCPYCAVQCGINLLVERNHVVGFEPRYDFPVNEGRLCPKGVTAYLQIHHPDRLLYPLIKRNGVFERASWDEALDLVVTRFKDIQARHGKDALGVYSGSSLTTEKTYLMGKFARAGLGTRYIDYNGRLCMVSAAAGNNKAFGLDRAANPWSDIPLAEVLLIAGANCAETFPVLNKFLWQQCDNGGRWIIVDPRETPTARQGDLHLQLRPGTDVALANGMLRVMIEEGLIDEAFITGRTNGWEETRDLAMRYTPQVASEITGVPAEDIVEAARLYGRASTSIVMHARGIEHHTNGVNNVLSYINLVLATCALVCPADAIKVSEEGIVMSALKPRCLDCRNCINACPFGVPKYNSAMHLQMKCDMCYDRTSEGMKPMCASVCPTGAISFGRYEQIVPFRRTRPVNVHVFGNQNVETKVYLMLPTDAREVTVDGCGVFEGRLELPAQQQQKTESWIDMQVEESDKSNEF